MKELSLFTGIGGGLLGSLLLGHDIVGAVEIDEYCCKVLEQRQKDGILPYFPIFQTDIRDFIRQGYAKYYKNRCDLVSAGFPCQPFSVAGRRKGENDSRNMWPETIEVIRQVRPKFCFLENVRGLLSSGYFQEILKDLAESGYDAGWRVLSAAEVGAAHKRDRLWVVAYTNNRRRTQCNAQKWTVSKSKSEILRNDWWKIEPALCGVVDGYAGRVAELQAAGNGQVPLVAATAWSLLTEEILDIS